MKLFDLEIVKGEVNIMRQSKALACTRLTTCMLENADRPFWRGRRTPKTKLLARWRHFCKWTAGSKKSSLNLRCLKMKAMKTRYWTFTVFHAFSRFVSKLILSTMVFLHPPVLWHSFRQAYSKFTISKCWVAQSAMPKIMGISTLQEDYDI